MQNGRTNCPHLQSGLKNWSDSATWGGTVPSAGTVVTLPSNTKVLLSGCMLNANATYTQIVIPSTSEVRAGKGAPIESEALRTLCNQCDALGIGRHLTAARPQLPNASLPCIPPPINPAAHHR